MSIKTRAPHSNPDCKCGVCKAKRGEQKGDKNPFWRGDSIGYVRVHKWINKTYGHPLPCEICGTHESAFFEWSNKDHKYSKNREDWQYVCRQCHKDYDRAKFGITGGRKKK